MRTAACARADAGAGVRSHVHWRLQSRRRPTAPSTASAPPPRRQSKPAATKAPEFKIVLEPRAIDLLKAMSARLAAAKTMSFTAVAGYEFPSKLGPPIVYTTRYDVALQRPDKLARADARAMVLRPSSTTTARR